MFLVLPDWFCNIYLEDLALPLITESKISFVAIYVFSQPHIIHFYRFPSFWKLMLEFLYIYIYISLSYKVFIEGLCFPKTLL